MRIKTKKVNTSITAPVSNPLTKAVEVGQIIVEKLQPYCDKISICGSVRRKSPFVKDIEIVCIPKSVPKLTLFEDVSKTVRHPGFVNELNNFRVLKGNRENGKYIQLLHTSGIKIDIFIADNDNYGMIVFQRTGPWDVSKHIIGWYIKRRGFFSHHSHLFKGNTNNMISVPEEVDFFKVLDIKFLEPEDRILRKRA